MKLVTRILCILFTLWWTLGASQGVLGANRCVADQNAAYEHVFCELKKRRSGDSLPTLAEFRRNPPAMQYLLLKRRAQSQGLELTEPAKLPAPTSNANKGVALPSKQLPTPPAARMGQPANTLNAPQTAGESIGCHFDIDQAVCAGRHFVRQGNKSNARLDSDALAAGNRLQLGAVSTQNEEQWLAEAYERYLRAMLSIGLAGSSFTYSGFAHTFYEHQARGTDFSARFAQMFEYLKRDKQQLAVSRRTPRRPPTGNECEWLSIDMLVCNSQQMNLVYLLRE